ncbi:MAG: hypothetical protein ACM3KE_06370 [Hyphomicrobiales bacterium]
MKRLLVISAAVLILVSPAAAQELKKLSMDDATSIGLQIENDPAIKAEGKSSVRITTLWPTTVCLGEISGLNIDNAKLIYKAKLKTDLQGTAYLEMWVGVGGGHYFSRGLNEQVQSKTEWKAVQTPFMLKKGQKPDKVTLNLVINGIGTVWVDDIVLSKEPL